MAFRNPRLPPPSDDETAAVRRATYPASVPTCPHCGWPLGTMPIRERRAHRAGACTEGAIHDDDPKS